MGGKRTALAGCRTGLSAAKNERGGFASPFSARVPKEERDYLSRIVFLCVSKRSITSLFVQMFRKTLFIIWFVQELCRSSPGMLMPRFLRT